MYALFYTERSTFTRGRARILTKRAHSVVKPLLKLFHEAGKSEWNDNEYCMNCSKYTLNGLLFGLKCSKTNSFLEEKFAMSSFRQDPSPTLDFLDLPSVQASPPNPSAVSHLY